MLVQIFAARLQKLHKCRWIYLRHLWVVRVGRSYGLRHMPSSDTACSLHLFPPWMPKERGVQHGAALKRCCRKRDQHGFPAHRSSESFGPSLIHSSSQRHKLLVKYDIGNRDQLVMEFLVIFFFFLIPLSLKCGQYSPSRRKWPWLEVMVLNQLPLKMPVPLGKVESHWSLQ